MYLFLYTYFSWINKKIIVLFCHTQKTNHSVVYFTSAANYVWILSSIECTKTLLTILNECEWKMDHNLQTLAHYRWKICNIQRIYLTEMLKTIMLVFAIQLGKCVINIYKGYTYIISTTLLFTPHTPIFGQNLIVCAHGRNKIISHNIMQTIYHSFIWMCTLFWLCFRKL